MILLENKFTSHLQSLAHTLVNSCIGYAKPTVRNRRAEMAQSPARAPKGVLHAFFESLLWCRVFPQKMALIPLRDASGFPIQCSTLLAPPAAIYNRNNLPRQTLALQPFPYNLPCAHTWSRRRGSFCRAWISFTSPRTWTECFAVPPPVVYVCIGYVLLSRAVQHTAGGSHTS